MRKAFILVDNMRMGGFQRVALDQAYEFSDKGFFTTLYIGDNYPSLPSPNFLSLENDLIVEKKVVIKALGSNWSEILFRLRELSRNLSQGDIILSHSMRSVVVLRILNTFYRKSNVVTLTIHQVPKLTDLIQRLKRFIYAQFATDLNCFSKSVEIDWYSQFNFLPAPFLKKFTRSIKSVPNGVYLPRLPHPSRIRKTSEKPRVIFLGRLSFWKGLESIKFLMTSELLFEYEFVFLVPAYDSNVFEDFERVLQSRLTVISGSTISFFDARKGDVHIYPANYGKAVTYFESISLNCLEFAGLGVPSVVTRGGMHTWDKDLFGSVFYETDWSNPHQTIKQILHANSDLEESRRSVEVINEIREEIDIGGRINFYALRD